MNASAQRVRVVVRGVVQGVGFRPFVHRLAAELGLNGFVRNDGAGVEAEAEGAPEALQAFLLRLVRDRPPLASIQSMEPIWLEPAGYATFEIRASVSGGISTPILPDIATCSECLRETFDPHDRRYRYPFTNCTHCGPRFTIVEALPYDRAHTTMKRFEMCAACRAEYFDPGSRRFHAQPNACPHCGPRLSYLDAPGKVQAEGHEALLRGAEAVRNGAILALKGLGGFHLVCDARNGQAVARLRDRKQREEKPFALLAPVLEAAAALCEVSLLEARVLCGPEAPIVLMRRKRDAHVDDRVAPGNPCLGVMLPSTPLHFLLMAELGFPVVATSGNRAEEPLCSGNDEALARLEGIADAFLVHDRPIARPVDDSVVRVIGGQERVLRRARGYAPLPIRLPREGPTLLALGGHQKSCIAMRAGRNVFLSQHLGDLESEAARAAFRKAAADLPRLYEAEPAAIACDAHPDYFSTLFARESPRRAIPVQHHYAHVLSCMAESELEPPLLGVSWDGTGYGSDGTIWGGEFLRVTAQGFERAAHLRLFRLPGGEAVSREPRRSALGALYEVFGDALFENHRDLPPLRAFGDAELRVLRTMLRHGTNAPRTSSAGRLFDAAASLAGVAQFSRFEGQAAMQWEWIADDSPEAYPVSIGEAPETGAPRPVDWSPMLRAMAAELREGQSAAVLSARFHNTLAETIVAVARRVGENRVVLSGGCFQNARLLSQTLRRLREEGFRPFAHQRVPPNDGGLALGQIAAAARELNREPENMSQAPQAKS